MHKQNMFYIAGPKGVLCTTLDNAVAGNACYEFDWVAKDQLEGRIVLMNENADDVNETIGMFLPHNDREGVAVQVAQMTIAL